MKKLLVKDYSGWNSSVRIIDVGTSTMFEGKFKDSTINLLFTNEEMKGHFSPDLDLLSVKIESQMSILKNSLLQELSKLITEIKKKPNRSEYKFFIEDF